MTVEELIKLNEPLEPETIKQLFPDLSDLDVEKILVIKLILYSNIIFEDMDVFENAVYVLNELKPDISVTQGATPKMIWKAVKEIKKLRPNLKEFSHEVLMYIKHIFNDNGYYFYPEDIGLKNNTLKLIKQNLNKKHYIENFLDIQTIKYKELLNSLD